ncbi:MAG: potassium-transporting ATPase subunit KdpC [Candidatus Brocadiia bacterium]
MRRQIRPALVALALSSALLGLVYPAVITAIARTLFPGASHGALIEKDGRALGSRLIGQPFTDPKYFWSRPSATTPFPYNAESSNGSNLGPTNPDLAKAVRERIAALRAADPGNSAPVPADLVTASASGLDPDITPAAAEFQVRRVARARKLDEKEVRALVARFTQDRQLGILGEARVNVLELNLALDGRIQQDRLKESSTD